MTSRLDSLKQGVGEITGALWKKPLASTAMLRTFGLFKLPLLAMVRPSVQELTGRRCVVRIPLSFLTKNHLGCMYIAVLTMGADVAGGLIAMRRVHQSGASVDLLFKEMEASFYKRIEGDAYFSCDAGAAIDAAVERALTSGERVNHPVPIDVTVPSKLGDEPAARFVMTLTLKRRD